MKSMQNAAGHLNQPKIGDIKQGSCELFFQSLKDLHDNTFDNAGVEFFHVRHREISLRALELQAVKLYDTLKFIAAPHVLEDKTHVPKTSEQCVAAARVAIAQFDDFKKGKK